MGETITYWFFESPQKEGFCLSSRISMHQIIFFRQITQDYLPAPWCYPQKPQSLVGIITIPADHLAGQPSVITSGQFAVVIRRRCKNIVGVFLNATILLIVIPGKAIVSKMLVVYGFWHLGYFCWPVFPHPPNV